MDMMSIRCVGTTELTDSDPASGDLTPPPPPIM